MEKDPTDLRGLEYQAEAEMKAQQIARDAELADIKQLLKLPHGRRFIWRQLEIAGVYRTSFSSDLAQMARAEGRRELGLMLLADIVEADPDVYTKMLKEKKRD